MTRIVGGPLDGHEYDLEAEPGETIELNTPAGVCVHRFTIDQADGSSVLEYLRPSDHESVEGT